MLDTAGPPTTMTSGPGSAPSIVTVDPRGIVVSATLGADAVVGGAPGALAGRPLADLIAPDEVGLLHDLLDADPDEDTTVVLTGRRDDGLPLVVAVTAPAGATSPAGTEPPTRALILQRWGGPVGWADDPQPPAPERTGPDHVLSHDARAAVRNARNFVGLFVRKLPLPVVDPDPSSTTTPDTTDATNEDARVGGAGSSPPPASGTDLPVGMLDTGLRALASGDEILDRIVWYLRLEQDPLAMRALPLHLLVELGRRQSQSDAELWAAADRTFATLADELTITGSGVEVNADAPLEIVGHHEGLVWCLAELFSNARKFAGGPTSVTVEVVPLAETGPWVELVVTNTGHRIDPRLAEDAFNLGRMLQGRGERPGVGLGLSLCRRIVVRHGGRIAFDPTSAATALRLRLLRAPASA